MTVSRHSRPLHFAARLSTKVNSHPMVARTRETHSAGVVNTHEGGRTRMMEFYDAGRWTLVNTLSVSAHVLEMLLRV